MERAKQAVFSPQNLVLMALFTAMQVILSRFLGIQVNEGLRISFECIPILLAGLWLGPVSGMLVGCVSDVLGTVLSGYGAYFPLLTLGPMLLGLLAGLGGRVLLPAEQPCWKDAWRVVVIVLAAEACNSLLYGTWALTLYYSIVVGREMPFSVLFAARLATKPFTMAADAVLVFLLHRAVYPLVLRRNASAAGAGAGGDRNGRRAE